MKFFYLPHKYKYVNELVINIISVVINYINVIIRRNIFYLELLCSVQLTHPL